MTWYAWAAVALIALSAALNVLSIGRPRKPITPGIVVGILIGDALFVWVIVALAVRGG